MILAIFKGTLGIINLLNTFLQVLIYSLRIPERIKYRSIPGKLKIIGKYDTTYKYYFLQKI